LILKAFGMSLNCIPEFNKKNINVKSLIVSKLMYNFSKSIPFKDDHIFRAFLVAIYFVVSAQ